MAVYNSATIDLVEILESARKLTEEEFMAEYQTGEIDFEKQS